jgi:hypothetical protein
MTNEAVPDNQPQTDPEEVLAITRFTRRGLTAARAEWQLIAAAHNLLKLFRYQPQRA